ncbi:GIY-YIG nuclease family protein [Tunicatimonas pelagia]|uniref:GIY-YIG nuclease family protein n=1 Tax=Tunicatimonas pelagia TaxID=931531 RepID=UPI002665C010|nr:GIY-YIG nuclease family protein [Tunicatimonas pelagia]WKN43434.1 GIY-YIG nuclease family protein [Tunicatimonas pelagia]
MERGGWVYMMTNQQNRVLYTGVTANLIARIHDHRTQRYSKSFTARYRLYRLVYYEGFSRIEEAIAREKQIKAGSRRAKEQLINGMNPQWRDLWEDIQQW